MEKNLNTEKLRQAEVFWKFELKNTDISNFMAVLLELGESS